MLAAFQITPFKFPQGTRNYRTRFGSISTGVPASLTREAYREESPSRGSRGAYLPQYNSTQQKNGVLHVVFCMCTYIYSSLTVSLHHVLQWITTGSRRSPVISGQWRSTEIYGRSSKFLIGVTISSRGILDFVMFFTSNQQVVNGHVANNG
eukprot:269615-Prorocentrum_minimum.AAC.4